MGYLFTLNYKNKMQFKSYLEQLKESNPEAYQQIYNELYDQIFDKVYESMTYVPNDEELFDLEDQFNSMLSEDYIPESDESQLDLFDDLHQDNIIDDFNDELLIPDTIVDNFEDVDPSSYMNEEEFESFDEFLRDNILGVCDVYPIQFIPDIISILISKGFQMLESSVISQSDVHEMYKMHVDLKSEKLLYIVVDFPIKTFFICEHIDQIKSQTVAFNSNSIINLLYESKYNFDSINYDNNL